MFPTTELRFRPHGLSALCSLALATGLMGLASAHADTLVITSFGGAYGDSQERAFVNPFSDETGIGTTMTSYSGGLAELRAQNEQGSADWDVIDLEMQDAVRACEEGLIIEIDFATLPPAPDGTPAIEDYIPDSFNECGAGTIMWSNIIAYNQKAFPDDPPSTAADFFDLDAYPGRRGIMNRPNGALELALLADGVPAEEVYDALRTAEGQDRAFARLDTIKDEITFWGAHGQAPQLLADGEVAMTIAANGRIYDAIAHEGQPFGMIWDGQIWNVDVWAINAVSDMQEEAMEFIRFSVEPERLASQTEYISYGPVRGSAQQFVGEDMRPHLPSHPDNLANAIPNDFQFWADHSDEIEARWSAWMMR